MENEFIRCHRCIMDSTVPGISFNEENICNYCTENIELLKKMPGNETERNQLLNLKINEIKIKGHGKKYDCIMGVSGGLDSSYALYIAKKQGLNPLAVHVDNGWNSELAVQNIERIVTSLDIDLFTFVIDWEEFRDLQCSFLKANVVDLELLSDHAISTTLIQLCKKYRLKYILAGTNTASEGMKMPSSWRHLKSDSVNIKDIYKKFGTNKKIKSLPLLSLTENIYAFNIKKIEWVKFLDFVDYNRDSAIEILRNELGYRPYEKKHYESIITRFYQGYILPTKFKVDKRLIHFSSLICSNQMNREEALKQIAKNPYDDIALLNEDKEYFIKKLGLKKEEFEDYIKAEPVPHENYKTYKKTLFFIFGKKIKGLLKK